MGLIHPPRRLVIALTLALLGSVLSLLGFTGISSKNSEPGRLVPVKKLIVWESKPRRGPAHGERATARFQLRNAGATVVRIRSVESSCGCTVASVAPKVVPPGGMAIVEAIGTPLDSGERVVEIPVHTDSVDEPDVTLSFKMITRRIPPFIQGISGDFAYLDGFASSEIRQARVETVERKQRGKAPIVATDLPFLTVSEPRLIQESPYDETSQMWRAYAYDVSFSRPPPEGAFSGKIWATDPWEGSKTHEMVVYGQRSPQIRVVPSVLEFEPNGKERKRLVVLTKSPEFDLSVEPDESSSGLLKIVEIDQRKSSRYRCFEVQVDWGKAGRRGEFGLIVQSRTDDSDRVIVPVIRREESP